METGTQLTWKQVIEAKHLTWEQVINAKGFKSVMHYRRCSHCECPYGTIAIGAEGIETNSLVFYCSYCNYLAVKPVLEWKTIEKPDPARHWEYSEATLAYS